MNIKEKVEKIQNVVKSIFDSNINKETSSAYKDGFAHAMKLIDIGIQKEFSEYIQVETNKQQEIRDLEKIIEDLKFTIAFKDAKIMDQRNNIIKLNQELVPIKIKVNTKKFGDIARFISDTTNRPYPKTKQQLKRKIYFEIIK